MASPCNFHRFAVFTIICCFSLLSRTEAQDKKSMDVTIRDFSSSHPDMEANNEKKCKGLTRGIVEFELGTDRKPVHTKKKCPLSDVNNWFRDTKDNQRYCRKLELTKVVNTENTYQSFNENFFPLDDVGTERFVGGHDNKEHNFHFCMEMHTTFKYRGGEEFHFEGDDDVWVYMNGKLAVDLGGEHGKEKADIKLDDEAGKLEILPGNYYNFDFFFCERKTSQSHLFLTTSIDLLPPPPPGLNIADKNLNVIPKNDTITVYKGGDASVFNSVEIGVQKETVDCNDVSTQTKTKVAGDWTFAGKSLGNKSEISLDPNGFDAGVFPLKVKKGVEYQIFVKIVEMPKLSPVVFDPKGKNFEKLLEVKLSQAQKADIYYTTGSDDFSTSKWTKYNGKSVSLNTSVTLRAIAVKQGFLNSDITAETYVRDKPAAVGGYYLDLDGDGHIETAVIQFDGAYTKAPEEVKLLNPFTKKPIEGKISISSDTKTKTIKLSFDPLEFGTSFKEDKLATVMALPGEYEEQLVVMADSVSPVIVKAESFPISPGRTEPYLVIQFSEDIVFSGNINTVELNLQRGTTTISAQDIKVSRVESKSSSSIQVTFEATSPYPVTGDSLRMAATSTIKDKQGNTYESPKKSAVTGLPPKVAAEIRVEIDSAVTQSTLKDPSVIQTGAVILSEKSECLDCKANEPLSVRLPGIAPQEVHSIGPTWTIRTKYPFKYDLNIFDNLGQFITHVSGEIDQNSFSKLEKSNDSATVKLTILPITAKKDEFPNGAFIVKGNLETTAENYLGPNQEPVTVAKSRFSLFKRFGYVRKNF